MTKITLNPVGNLINATTAETNIDNNFAVVETAMDNTLSRDGTSPNQMEAALDMNSNQIYNLPAPTSNNSPVRVIDLADLATGGTINVSSLPLGGTTGQVLKKNSNTDFDAGWETTHYLTTGGSAGQVLAKNSSSDYDASWVNPSIALTPGGAPNSIQYNSSGSFAGLSLGAGQVVTSAGTVPVAALPAMVNVVTAYGIDNTGATDVSSALQTAITTINNADCIVYLPEGTYNMGSGSLNIPSYCTIVCHPNAVLRRTSDPTYSSPAAAMVYWTGTGVKWYGGVLENTVVLATSTTSNTINGSNKTFTTQAGLPLVAGSSFVRIWSASHPEAHFEQVVASYSGTTLTINSPFNGGSGTYSDWNIGFGHTAQTAITIWGGTNSLIEGTRITGNWYVGAMMDGWNPPAGGSLLCKFNTLRGLIVEGVQNRGIYLYGNCNDNLITGCFVNGTNIFNGCTDYCFNFNAANASGSANAQLRNKVVDCVANNYGFQGYGAGDIIFYMLFSNCSASNGTNTASAGFLLQFANVAPMQMSKVCNCTANNNAGIGFQIAGALYTVLEGCMAVANANGYIVGPSGANQAQYCSLSDCLAISNTGNGVTIQGNSVRTNLGDVVSVNNNFGIVIQSAASVTTVTGCRAFNNGGGNYSDAGSGTVGTPTTT